MSHFENSPTKIIVKQVSNQREQRIQKSTGNGKKWNHLLKFMSVYDKSSCSLSAFEIWSEYHSTATCFCFILNVFYVLCLPSMWIDFFFFPLVLYSVILYLYRRRFFSAASCYHINCYNLGLFLFILIITLFHRVCSSMFLSLTKKS